MRNSAKVFIVKNSLTKVEAPADVTTKFQPGVFGYIDMKGRIKQIKKNDGDKTNYVLTLIKQGRLYGRLIGEIKPEPHLKPIKRGTA